MTDDFAICPKCGEENSLVNIVPQFPHVVGVKEIAIFTGMLLCTRCWTAHNKKDVKYHYVGDEPDE